MTDINIYITYFWVCKDMSYLCWVSSKILQGLCICSLYMYLFLCQFQKLLTKLNLTKSTELIFINSLKLCKSAGTSGCKRAYTCIQIFRVCSTTLKYIGVNLLEFCGDSKADAEGLAGGEELGPRREGTPAQKIQFFAWNGMFWWILSGNFWKCGGTICISILLLQILWTIPSWFTPMIEYKSPPENYKTSRTPTSGQKNKWG